MARFFIDRPVFAIVLSLFITIGGLIAAYVLPIAQYPQISPPRVSVSAFYLGAGSEAVQNSVAQIIEQQINGVEGMQYMTSTSGNDGTYSLDVVFDSSRNADISAVQVQNKVAQATSSLPQSVNNSGITTAKQSPDAALYFVMYSPNKTFDATFLKNYASIQIVDSLKRIKGVASVGEYGADFAMRVWLQADKMANLNVTVSDIQQALVAQNVQSPAGRIGEFPSMPNQEFQYTARVEGRLSTPEQFGNIIIRAAGDGSAIRLKDVATIELGAKNYLYFSDYNGKEAVSFVVKLTPDANALETVGAARKVIEDASKKFPLDMQEKITYDSTTFVDESLKEVKKTFFEALILVLIIVFLFLQSWRATLVPMLAIPVSLIGTFIAFMAFGFSINTITLFAMILAIGLVVDDAIVVVEAAEHNMRHKQLSPKDATIQAMKEVSGPVVAIAFVLASVFVPVAFFGGIVGVLYKQFALTIAVSMVLSAIVALSLTPALCVLLLKPHSDAAVSKRNYLARFFAWFNTRFDSLVEWYGSKVGLSIRKIKLALVLLAIICVVVGFGFNKIPGGFVPDEDQGYFIAAINLPEASSIIRTREVGQKINAVLQKISGVQDVIVISGIDILSGVSKPNSALAVVSLKPWSERSKDESVDKCIYTAMAAMRNIPEANFMAFNASALPGLGGQGKISFMIQNRAGASLAEMQAVAAQFTAELQKHPETAHLYTTFRNNTPGIRYDVDRTKTETLGVPINNVYQTMQAFMGGVQVNDISLFGRTYKVVMQAEPEFRQSADSIRFFYVRSNTGTYVPLNTLAAPAEEYSSPMIKRYNGYPTIQIGGDPTPGYSTGQTMAVMEKIADSILPKTYSYEWSDMSREEKDSSGKAIYIFGFAILFVFLCLAALYESWSVPFAVLLSVPTGILGAIAFQLMRQFENDVYMQIGIVMLIGLAAKNAILIVEFAKARTDAGEAVIPATIAAAKVRLRPIIMTSLAFVIGCLPLMLATGAGAGARSAMGNTVVGGILFATVLGIFLVPVLFVTVKKIGALEKKKAN